MSLIIQGIDLPKEDEVMVITVWGDDKEGTAFISNKEPYITVPINAVQIPKEHGRIGDFDLFKNMIRDSVPAYRIGVKIPTYGDMDIMDKIEFMPTILEAEE